MRELGACVCCSSATWWAAPAASGDRGAAEAARRYQLDFVAINGENAAGGFGITEAILEDLLGAGADVVTLGNHSFDQKEALVFIERQERLLRPINYPPGTPGKGAGMFKAATAPTCWSSTPWA